MRFFLGNSNASTVTTAQNTIAPDVTANGNTTIMPLRADTTDWISVVLPVLGVLAVAVYLFRLCYKALRDDERQNDLNNRYSSYV